MPLYEFECANCDWGDVEKQMSISKYIEEKNQTECPVCQTNMKPKVSRSDFVLKGGGWYKDGYHK